MNKSTRPGFKLIELVLVIGLVGLLMLLIVPGIMKVRESQARTQTSENLRACAIAVHNYHGTNNRFPNAGWTGGSYKEDGEDRSMWFHLLPFVQQKAAYEENRHDAVVPVYLTAQDPSLRNPAGRVCFAGNIRLFGYKTLTPTKADSAVGDNCQPTGQSLRTELAATMKSDLTLARITDGTSNTFMLATRYAECGSPLQATHYSASPIGTFLGGAGLTPSIGTPTSTVKGAFFGAGSHDRPPDATSSNTMFQEAPQVTQCLADDSVFGHAFGVEGLFMALADGSVRTFDASTGPGVFCRALCPSDGCTVNEGLRLD